MVELQWHRGEIREVVRGGVRDGGSRVWVQTIWDGVELCGAEYTLLAGGAKDTHHIVIHVGMDGPVRACVIPRGDENGVALSDRNNEPVDWVRLNISL